MKIRNGVLILAVMYTACQSHSNALAQGSDVANSLGLHGWSANAAERGTGGDLAASLPGDLPPLPHLLTAPDPAIGMFWSAGNPGAAAREVTGAYRTFTASHGRENGAYRRPFDPRELASTLGAGMGWQRFGPDDRGVAIGVVRVESRSNRDVSFVATEVPYTESPFVLSDTSHADNADRTSVSLESAIGWGSGPWGFGLSVAYDVAKTNTDRAPLAKLGRSAAPAAAVGLTRSFRDGRYGVGLLGRVVHRTESVLLTPAGAFGEAYALAGYIEVEPISLRQSGVPRHIERDANGLGVAVRGETAGAHWVLFGEMNRGWERQIVIRQANPPTDRWATDVVTWGGSVSRSMFRDRLRAVAVIRQTALDGDARLSDLDGIFFRNHAERGVGTIDVRAAPASRQWEIAAVASVIRDVRVRTDFVSRLETRVEGWTPGVAIEASRSLSPRLRTAAGLAAAWYSPITSVPDPTNASELYRRVFAPELGIQATPLQSRAGSLSMAWTVREPNAIWARIEYQARVPDASLAREQLALSGERRMWSFTLGSSVQY